jgi:hypothetical protein
MTQNKKCFIIYINFHRPSRAFFLAPRNRKKTFRTLILVMQFVLLKVNDAYHNKKKGEWINSRPLHVLSLPFGIIYAFAIKSFC